MPVPAATTALPSLFDAHLHPEGLAQQDLESMRFFGLRAALASPLAGRASARDLLERFEDLLARQLPRLDRAGIRGYAALGVPPQSLPRRGLSEVLSALPSFFRAGQGVALGPIGLWRGGLDEEEALVEQLALARRLKLPVWVHTPARDKERLTRRILALLREASFPPARALLDRANGRTLAAILACGHFAGLTVHPEELRVERVAQLVRRLGTRRMVVNTHSGEGASDILGMARLASVFARGGLSPKVVKRLCFANAAAFLQVRPTSAP